MHDIIYRKRLIILFIIKVLTQIYEARSLLHAGLMVRTVPAVPLASFL